MNLIRVAAVMTVVLGLLLPPSILAASNSTEGTELKSDLENTISDFEDDQYTTQNPFDNIDISENITASEVTTSEPITESPVTETGRNDEYFTCDNGVSITFEKVCDGILDCPDGTDEKCIFGACNSTNECQCAATKKCIPRNSSDRYLFQDDVRFETFYIQTRQSMTLHCPTANAITTNWYMNNKTVPLELGCTIEYQASNSTLFCPNIKHFHGGIYSCERFYDFSWEPEIIQTTVFIKEGSSFGKQSCFCFGATTRCKTAYVNYEPLIPDNGLNSTFETPLSSVTLKIEDGRKSLLENNGSKSEIVNGTVYYLLSEKITQHQLSLYGGFILYNLTAKSVDRSGTPSAVMLGDGKVLLYYPTDNYNSSSTLKKLSFSPFGWRVLSEDGNFEGRAMAHDMMPVLNNLNGIYVRLERAAHKEDLYSQFSLYMINSSQSGTLSYINKCSCPPEYNGTYCESCATDYTRNRTDNSCVPVNYQVGENATIDGNAEVWEEEDEQEYDAENTNSDVQYYEDGTDDPTDDIPEEQEEVTDEPMLIGEGEGSIDYWAKQDTYESSDKFKFTKNEYFHENQSPSEAYFECKNKDQVRLSNVCDGYYNCDDGGDEVCYSGECDDINKCRCAYTGQCVPRTQSHFYLYEHTEYTRSHLHVVPKSWMLLECPLGYANDFVEVNWYRNDKGVPTKCEIRYPTTKLNVSQLFCPNMTIADEGVYTCEHVHNTSFFKELYSSSVVVFVRNESIFEKDSCYCFEATTTCQSTTVIRDHEEVKIFYQPSDWIRSVADSDSWYHHGGMTGNYMTLDNIKLSWIPSWLANYVFYNKISKEITNFGLDLYGGSFTYFSGVNPTSENEYSPLAVMHGDDKVLVYYENGNYGSQYKRLSFSKHNWRLLYGDGVSKVSEADIMKVLGNLKGIYVKTFFAVGNYTRQYYSVDLSLLKFRYNGQGMPSSIETCSCPPGYTGNYCERCAENYVGNPVKNRPCVPKVHVNGKNSLKPLGRSAQGVMMHMNVYLDFEKVFNDTSEAIN